MKIVSKKRPLSYFKFISLTPHNHFYLECGKEDAEQEISLTRLVQLNSYFHKHAMLAEDDWFLPEENLCNHDFGYVKTGTFLKRRAISADHDTQAVQYLEAGKEAYAYSPRELESILSAARNASINVEYYYEDECYIIYRKEN